MDKILIKDIHDMTKQEKVAFFFKAHETEIEFIRKEGLKIHPVDLEEHAGRAQHFLRLGILAMKE